MATAPPQPSVPDAASAAAPARRVQRPVAEIELVHLVEIKSDEFHNQEVPEAKKKRLVLQEALVEWKAQVAEFDAKVEKRTKRTDQLTNEIYQLVGLYSVFVGVVFTAVLQSNRVECRHIWSPIVLCVVAFLVLWIVIDKKSKLIKTDRRTIQEDQAFRKRRVEHISKLKSEGPSRFDFSHPKFESESLRNEKANYSAASSGSLGWVIAILTFFTLVLLVSFVHILCIHPVSIDSSSSCPACPPAPK